MKLLMTSSRWGNLYRFRYYVNGKRVSERAFAEAREAAGPNYVIRSSDATSYGYRTAWEYVG